MSISLDTGLVIYNGKPTKILISDGSDSGALVALANALILKECHFENATIEELEKLTKGDNITKQDLEKALINIGCNCSVRRGSVDELAENLAKVNISDTDGTNNRIRQLAQMLPLLADVDPVFNGTFKEASKTNTFQLYGVELLHGWVIDNPENSPLWDKISKLSNREARSLIESNDRRISDKINFFLSKSNSQLTEKGLQHLKSSVKEGSFAILFRLNQFYTLCKKDDELFYLVAHKDLPKVFWHPLRCIDDLNNTENDGVIDDTLAERIQRWIYSKVESLDEADKCNIELEMKYGIIIDPKTKMRMIRRSSMPIIYNHRRVKMKPTLDEGVFRRFENYMKFKYEDGGIRSRTKDSMYRIKTGVPHGSRNIRESKDLQTGAIKEVIEKKRADSIFICRPNDSYDMKLSINLELPVVGKETLKGRKKRTNVRIKNRTSYFPPGSRIDITYVTNNPWSKSRAEITREIEVEMPTTDLLSGWEVRDKDNFPTNKSVGVFLNTAVNIDEKLTSLS